MKSVKKAARHKAKHLKRGGHAKAKSMTHASAKHAARTRAN
jgi:hypothetical protein